MYWAGSGLSCRFCGDAYNSIRRVNTVCNPRVNGSHIDALGGVTGDALVVCICHFRGCSSRSQRASALVALMRRGGWIVGFPQRELEGRVPRLGRQRDCDCTGLA